MHSPRILHLEVINRVLRYLKRILGKEILMKNNDSDEICGYADED
jgi:hypothetical protein